MNRCHRSAAAATAGGRAAPGGVYTCEPLEGRLLLDANDPVLVVVEPIQEYFDIHTIPDVEPYLWRSTVETNWNLHDFNQQPPPWENVDLDGNGYPGDAYGWNFALSSPNFILADGSQVAGHGRWVSVSAVNVLRSAGAAASRVKIMYVIGGSGLAVNLGVPSAPLKYILDRKAAGANIVAVGTIPGVANRAGAQALADAGIMLVGGITNSNTNFDPIAGNVLDAFWSATPRSGVEAPALDNVIPVTTDPALSLANYGINSFYGGVPGHALQSFADPAAGAMVAVAVQAYQDAHEGQNPTVQQIKRAMMSGVDYSPDLHNRTITHDYVEGVRQHGGVFNMDKIIAAINEPDPRVTGVSMTQVAQDPLSTTVQFQLNGVGDVSNWTISWGDESGPDNSGVQVLDGDATTVQHTFPFQNVPRHYFPTIYAMSGAKQVYLPAPSAQVDVLISTPFAPTSGPDHYTLSRSGTDTVLTLENAAGTISHAFAPGELENCLLTLGEGPDTLTVDFTNGDPLVATSLEVRGVFGAGAQVRVIGSPGNDVMSVTGFVVGTVAVNSTQFTVDEDVQVQLDGGPGDDRLTGGSPGSTLVGGAGRDFFHLPYAGLFPVAVDGGPGPGVDTVTGLAGPDASVSNVEYFVTTDSASGNTSANRYNAAGLLLFAVEQSSAGHARFAVAEPLAAVDDLRAFGTLVFGEDDELVPVGVPVTSLVVDAQDKDEMLSVRANVPVTVNGAGGNDTIDVVAPTATIVAGAGHDTVYTGGGTRYVVNLGAGANTFHGGAAADEVTLVEGAADTLFLGGGDDIVDAREDVLDDDVIDGGDGYDRLLLLWGHVRTSVSNVEEIGGAVAWWKRRWIPVSGPRRDQTLAPA